MRWHVIVRAGNSDTFTPEIGDEEPRIMVPFDRPADPWRFQGSLDKPFDDAKLRRPVGVAKDLLRLGVVVYSADTRVNREFSDDKWSRKFRVYMPVSDVRRWNKAAKVLVDLLTFLTGDDWAFVFREVGPSASLVIEEAAGPPVDAVCLFSGGLDSLVGAIDLLAAGKRVALVGHHGAGLTNSFQTDAVTELRKSFDEIVPFMFGMQPPKSDRRHRKPGEKRKQRKEDGESSMRGRSMLFFSLALAVAESFGKGTTVVAAENGLISLNVPLTVARQGSLSTRTTHPYVVRQLRELGARLKLTTNVDMPYRFKTKGEMLKECRDPDVLAATTPKTMSCSHSEAGRWNGKFGMHCGYCVPCVIRRASTLAAGAKDAKYGLNARTTRPAAETVKGRDLRAFEIAVERYHAQSRAQRVTCVLDTGPIDPAELSAFTDVYERGMEEVAKLLRISKPKKAKGKK